MSFDTFQSEQKILERAEQVLTDPEKVDLSLEYGSLTKAYRKLFKMSRRIVNMSDRSEERLKEANVTILAQQKELEHAHQKLSGHAQLLEEKVKERTKELVAAQSKLEKLVELGIALSLERNHSRFMEMIIQGEKQLTNADGAIFLSLRDDTHLQHEILWYDSLDLKLGGLSDQPILNDDLPLRDEHQKPRYFDPVVHAVLTERSVNVANIYENDDFDFSGLMRFDQHHQYRTQSFLAVPLKPRKGEVIGVLVLVNARVAGTGRLTSFNDEAEAFIEALASQAAVAMDNQNLMKAQTKLFDSILEVLASAIDTKSPYTGGHCARVPVICNMLARVACDATEGTLADFDMDEMGWREFHLANWLHDCGKVTTPEYVVDKATKLEVIYNRIHEIRTRFEVKLRDFTIEHLQSVIDGGDPETLSEELGRSIRKLHDDFAFVAECNRGGEFLDQDSLDRLQKIGRITWQRHFSDRLGISVEEMQRVKRIVPKPLPVTEKLLEDKREHIIRRSQDDSRDHSLEKYGITIKPPKYLYNRGELYNLSVAKGTLTEEERYKINEHAIHSLIMLKQLPFPKQLAKVPEFAASHHETMDGKGYPRALTGDEMSVQAKILAISDIFEALTASDRPYKKTKTLAEAIKIMSFMRDSQHIDTDLFDLFLSSGVYQDFARQHLEADQIDEVDHAQYLSIAR